MTFSDFSSWPRDQEQSFVPFEQHVFETQKKAWTIGGTVSIVFLVLALAIYFGVTPTHSGVGKDTEQSNLTTKSSTSNAEPAAEKK